MVSDAGRVNAADGALNMVICIEGIEETQNWLGSEDGVDNRSCNDDHGLCGEDGVLATSNSKKEALDQHIMTRRWRRRARGNDLTKGLEQFHADCMGKRKTGVRLEFDFPPDVGELVSNHSLDVIFLCETKRWDSEMRKIQRKLNFENGELFLG